MTTDDSLTVFILFTQNLCRFGNKKTVGWSLYILNFSLPEWKLDAKKCAVIAGIELRSTIRLPSNIYIYSINTDIFHANLCGFCYCGELRNYCDAKRKKNES